MENEYILQLENIYKDFPGVIALNNVNFDLKPGEVHAVIGENGAGKSTLVKIICGVYRKRSGSIFLNGDEIDFANTKEALEQGITSIYQEVENVPKLTVAENIFLGILPKNTKLPFFIDWDLLMKKTKRLLSELDMDINPRLKLNELSIAHQQLIEVAKALSRKVRILIMDEPTSSLTSNEVDKLFNIINNLKEKNVGVIYISHKLNEVMDIANRITVLRDGKNVGTLEKKDFNEINIIKLMTGHILEEEIKYSIIRKEVIMEVKNLRIYKRIKDISFELFRGEILGIVGLAGSGKDEMIKSLYGLWPYESNGIFVESKRIKIRNPDDAISRGIVYLPEERKIQSLFSTLSVLENFSVTWLNKTNRRFFISRNKEIKKIGEFIKKLSIKVADIKFKIFSLSGGNQQKIVFSRLLSINPKILLLHDPTRGIDVGSREEIWKIIKKLASEGSSVIFISSEISEVCDLSNRVLVLSKGSLCKEFIDNEIIYEDVLSCVMTS
ncbi:MAG: sugar ABC transporter ATP-binding protein [Actinobacteria bacterium]|nr:sugar ABC transporter ATP-binding protein [Actinomycetota bacterium]